MIELTCTPFAFHAVDLPSIFQDTGDLFASHAAREEAEKDSLDNQADHHRRAAGC
eukprot:COSAG02_NODE_7434_length_3015_cov_1.120713_2_plen_55_part_00